MDIEGSVSLWLDQLRQGDDEAARKLWERYFERLVELADQKLPRHVRRDFDEEDVALSAFQSLCLGVRRGRFPDLNDRYNLWALLVVITGCKVMNRMRERNAKKRGGGRVQGESALLKGQAGEKRTGMDQVIGREPSADFAQQVSEQCEYLLSLLPENSLRKVALMKMEGYNNEEIAKKLGTSKRTVERRLGVIRNAWIQFCEPDVAQSEEAS